VYARLKEVAMRASPFAAAGFALCLALIAGPAGAQADAKGFVRLTPEQAEWKDVPNGHGVQMAVVSGDPSKPGLYVIRVRFPPGIMSAPHFHPEDRHAVVLKGTWYTGTDDSWDPDRTVALKAGSYMKHPARAVHYDGAKNEEVIVQIAGYGPSGTTEIFPAEARFGVPHKLK
jgi:quercetin dioxygenase-like cupin family protein